MSAECAFAKLWVFLNFCFKDDIGPQVFSFYLFIFISKIKNDLFYFIFLYLCLLLPMPCYKRTNVLKKGTCRDAMTQI